MSQKGELIFAVHPLRFDSEDLKTAPNVAQFWKDMFPYLFADNQELFIHVADYFSPDSDDSKQVPTNSSVLPHLMQPKDCFNNLIKWLVKKQGKVTQAKLTLQTKDRDIKIYIQKEKENAC